MWGGYLVFGIVALVGWRLFARGLRNDILDASGHQIAGRAWFLVGGILMQVPLVVFTIFAWRQGLFG